MDSTIIYIIVGIVALLVGALGGKALFAKNTDKQVQEAELEAKKLIAEAQLKADTYKREREIEAKERFAQMKIDSEKDVLQRTQKIIEGENRIKQKEQSLNQKEANVDKQVKDNEVIKDFTHGNLDNWGRGGVLLLNAILTVVAHTPASHKGKGWEEFTDVVIKTISDKHEHIVFMLWGNYARSKKTLIDGSRHLILEAPHPSPFSAHSGFFGCRHFSKCNEYLVKHGKNPIQW